MANKRITALTEELTPATSDVVAIDGATTRKATIVNMVNAARPFATQAEAEAGSGTTQGMNPLTTKQSIAIEVGVTLQAYDADLGTIAGLAKTDGNVIVGDGTNWVAESGATARTSLGVAIGSDVQAYSANLDEYAAVNPTVAGLALLDDVDAAAQRTTLGLGTMATQAAAAVAITGGSVAGITDLAVADGGTGASDAATARTNLGLVIGTNVQAYDADLAAIAGLTTAADKVPYFTGSGLAALADFSAFGRTLVDDADAAAGRTTLGVVIGTDVQAYSTHTAAVAALDKTDGNFVVTNGTTFVAESGSTARASLGAMGTGFEGATGTIPDARLPTRLNNYGANFAITDWDTITESGWYAVPGAANAPDASGAWFYGSVVAGTADYVVQELTKMASDTESDTVTWRRVRQAGVWIAWYRIRSAQAELDARYLQTSGVSAFAATFLDDADAAAVRATLGVGTGTGDMVGSNNLSDLTNAATARSNLGAASLAGNTFTGAQLLPDGSLAAPALSFSGDTDTGLYRIGANEIGIGSGGVLQLRASSTRTLMPLAQSDGARVEVQKHSAPASYSTIRGAMVVQAEQLVDQASTGVFSEGLLVTLDKDFDGPVTLGPPSSSQSVSPPMRVVVTNTGDGSLPSYHGTTSVYAVGATGYNEGGGFSQTVQNVASTNCILSGVEVILRDSIDAGVTDFDTEMHVLVPRIARFNAGSESSAFIYCSSEGSVAPDAIMKLNPNSLASVGTGFDLREWSFTTGQVMQFPNDVAIAWESSAGALVECINLTSANQLILKPAGTAATIALQGGSATTKLLVSETGLGFFGTAAVARPTGVAVTAAGVHAALVTLGLITA